MIVITLFDVSAVSMGNIKRYDLVLINNEIYAIPGTVQVERLFIGNSSAENGKKVIYTFKRNGDEVLQPHPLYTGKTTTWL